MPRKTSAKPATAPRTVPADKSGPRDLSHIFCQHGLTDYRWIDPAEIVVAEWVRMKCRFGCREYGRNAACPPSVPGVDECARFFRDYKRAAVFHVAKSVEKPEDRHAWSRKVNLELLDIELDVFKAGYYKAFLLFLDSCGVCLECSGNRLTCKEPKLARPTPEAMAVDVFSTVKKLGYPIEVLSGYKQEMNRYAFLLID